MDPALTPLDPAHAAAALERAMPGAKYVSSSLLKGSFSNSTWVIEGQDARAARLRIVVRRLRGGWSDPGARARLEFRALEIAGRSGIPVARPLLLDDTGDLLGAPGFVASFIDGTQLLNRGDRAWARELACVLARIHAVRCVQGEGLLDARGEALYFLKSGAMPREMIEDRDGKRVWDAVQGAIARVVIVDPVLVHLDYWTGNLLWRDGRIVAVVDWEEASCGDPAIDVAYMKRDLWGAGMREEAEWFVEEYESETGRPLANLPFWELAAAVRPMPNPGKGVGSLTALGVNDRSEQDLVQAHRDFIESALRRLS